MNGKKYIRQTIESVISQKSKHIEYILTDGGSSDDTISIIEEYVGGIDCFISESDNEIFDAINKE